MARKYKEVTFGPDAGRDAGKTFLITEMPATQAESWGERVLAAMAKSGLDVPENVANAGMAGVLAMGFKALFGVDWREARPLLDEMFTCVKIVQPAMTRALIEDDIEEVKTRLLLRSEVIELHVGFSPAAVLSKMWTAAAQRIAAASVSLDTETSAPESQPSSAIN